jgi:general nucleoside transport system permease protein
MGLFEAILLSVIAASTPLLLAASGELVVERSGVLNLGIEGMMIMGAACGFAAAYFTGSITIGAIAGAAAGAGMSAIFALLTLGLAVNQVAAGLALTIFGIGLSGLIGANFVGERIEQAPHLHIPLLTDIPVVGKILFGEDAFVYVSILLVVGIWWFLYRTRGGLVLRAVGDNHASAHALGYPVLKIRTHARASAVPICRSPIRRSSCPA